MIYTIKKKWAPSFILTSLHNIKRRSEDMVIKCSHNSYHWLGRLKHCKVHKWHEVFVKCKCMDFCEPSENNYVWKCFWMVSMWLHASTYISLHLYNQFPNQFEVRGRSIIPTTTSFESKMIVKPLQCSIIFHWAESEC